MSFGLLCKEFKDQQGDLKHLPALPSPQQLFPNSSCGSHAAGWGHGVLTTLRLHRNLAGKVAGDKSNGNVPELLQKHLEGAWGESVTSVTLSLMAPSEQEGFKESKPEVSLPCQAQGTAHGALGTAPNSVLS